MERFKTIQQAIRAVHAHEPCRSSTDALIALGLRALLAAIGSLPDYRRHYIAKGGTVLRLRSPAPLERLSTDLDLSGIEFGPGPIDHHQFAADLGRTATGILLGAFERGSADLSVTFERSGDRAHRGEENPETEVYLVAVSAQLGNGARTVAKGRGYKIDLTCDEYVDQTLIEDLRVESYHIPIDVLAYTPLQSAAEKLRSLLQKRRHRLRTGNAANLVPRHLFDLAVLRDMLAREQTAQLMPELFRRKCAARHIDIDHTTRDALLDPELLAAAKVQDAQRAVRGWEALQALIALADLPTTPPPTTVIA